MQTKLIEFQTTDNLFLPGLLYTPKKETDSAVIFLHGCGDSSVFYSVNRSNTLAKELTKKGLSLLMFNNRGAHILKRIKKIENEEEMDVWMGTGMELIKDCVHDIDGAVEFLKNLGYKKIYLAGHSTGANKIVVYNKYKPKNEVKKYILLGSGDDVGIGYQIYGEKKFLELLKKAKEKIDEGKGSELTPKYFKANLMSYQSFFDMNNPDGDYNAFPFKDYIENLNLSKKKPFEEYANITKKTLVVYGENDPYCIGTPREAIAILEKVTNRKSNFEYKIVPETDHGFHGKYQELGKLIADWA